MTENLNRAFFGGVLLATAVIQLGNLVLFAIGRIESLVIAFIPVIAISCFLIVAALLLFLLMLKLRG